MAGTVPVDISPRGSIGIGQFIGRNANDGSIPVVEYLQSPVYVTAVYRNDVRKAESCPEEWARIVSERVNECIVDAV
jgi:hypothetical protein